MGKYYDWKSVVSKGLKCKRQKHLSLDQNNLVVPLIQFFFLGIGIR